jgi:hypothetical protein
MASAWSRISRIGRHCLFDGGGGRCHTSGIRHAVPLPCKDLGIVAEIAQTKGVSIPKAAGTLAASVFATLTDPEVDGQEDAP